MHMKTFHVVLLVAGAAILAAMLARSCAPAQRPDDGPGTVDTVRIYIPDTGWHVPVIPPAQGADMSEHWRGRYEHYKADAAAKGAELLRLSGRLDSLLLVGDCEAAGRALADELAMWRDQGRSDSAYIAELSALAAVRRYVGTDSTADWVHRYDITVTGELLPGGYKYRTDFLQRTVVRRVPSFRRYGAAALLGTGPDGRMYGAEGSFVFAAGRARAVAVAGWDTGPFGMAGLGLAW